MAADGGTGRGRLQLSVDAVHFLPVLCFCPELVFLYPLYIDIPGRPSYANPSVNLDKVPLW